MGQKRSAKALLTHRIPDSTLIRIHNKALLKERWDLIVTEFTEKGAFDQADLRARFMQSRCSEKGNVREFLDTLRVKKEELSTYEVVIDDKDYRSTIISSLPLHLSNFASNLFASARLYASSKTVDPDTLITLISEESERNVMIRSRRSGKSSKGEEKDEAMAASSSSGKGKASKQKPRGVCWNCGEKGHYKDKCPKPDKSSENKDSPKKKATANVAEESDSEEGGAFFALMTFSTRVCPSCNLSQTRMTILISIPSGWDTEELSEVDSSKCGLLVDVDSDSEASDLDDLEEFAANVEVNNKTADSPRAEVYDSGCTSHITPYRDAIDNFVETSPRPFRAANKQSFRAVGRGEMTVDVQSIAFTPHKSSSCSFTTTRGSRSGATQSLASYSWERTTIYWHIF